MTTPTQADLDSNITRLPKQRMEMKSVVIGLGNCPACREPLTASADLHVDVMLSADASGGWNATSEGAAPPLTVNFRGAAVGKPVVDRFGITHRCGGRAEEGSPA